MAQCYNKCYDWAYSSQLNVLIMYKLKPSTQQHKIQTCTNHHCQHCNSHIDVQISMYNINMPEIAKEKAKAWFRRAELIPSSLVLFIEESISSSFRSIRDCAEIAAWAAAEAASEPTMADKNATWENTSVTQFSSSVLHIQSKQQYGTRQLMKHACHQHAHRR